MTLLASTASMSSKNVYKDKTSIYINDRMTLLSLIFLTLLSGATATTTEYETIEPSYIITYTPTPYTTSNGVEGILMMTDFHYTNTTYNIPIVDAPISIENMLYNIMYQSCQLVLYILSYKYIINTLFFIYNTYKRTLKYLDSIVPDEPMPSVPEYELPSITINETIIDDEDDEDQNCSLYKTYKYEMVCYNSNKIKIDDIAFNGECFIETNNEYLFTNNYRPVKFNNPTYRQLLTAATLSPIFEKNKIIDVCDVSINTNKKYNNIQIITINYTY